MCRPVLQHQRSSEGSTAGCGRCAITAWRSTPGSASRSRVSTRAPRRCWSTSSPARRVPDEGDGRGRAGGHGSISDGDDWLAMAGSLRHRQPAGGAPRRGVAPAEPGDADHARHRSRSSRTLPASVEQLAAGRRASMPPRSIGRSPALDAADPHARAPRPRRRARAVPADPGTSDRRASRPETASRSAKPSRASPARAAWRR